jgi:putative Mn2+ efflux pump MntP
MDFTEYIQPGLLVLVPVLLGIGAGLKKSEVKDKHIPLILGCTGVFLALCWVLGTSIITTAQEGIMAAFTAITQGILCAGAAVYGHQLFKQSRKDE